MKKQNEDKVPHIKKEGWKAEELAEEATNKEDDEIVRQMLRGDESKGDADERDVAPALDSNKSPNGSKEKNSDDE